MRIPTYPRQQAFLQISLLFWSSITLSADFTPIEAWVERALSFNPDINATREWNHSLNYRVGPSGTLPNPIIGYRHYTQSAMKKQAIEIMQDVPFPGTLRHQRNATRLSARSAAFDTQEGELELAYEVRVAYARSALLSATLGQLLRDEHLLEDMQIAVESALRGGNEQSARILRVQMDQVRISDQIGQLRKDLAVVHSQLRRLLALKPEEDLPSQPSLKSLPDSLPDYSASPNINLLPSTQAAQATVEASEQRVNATRAANRPNLRLGAEWMEERGEDEISVFAGISLPIFRGSVRDAEREALARQRAAFYELEAVRLNRSQQILETRTMMEDAKRQLQLYREKLLPLAEAGVEAESAAYESGATQLSDMISAQRTLVQTQIEYDTALANHYMLSARYLRETTEARHNP